MNKNSKPNPDVKRKEPKFFIPKEFFNQLNEYSNGGYILIAMDELGDPVIYTRFDNQTVKVGLQTHAERYFRQKNNVEPSFTVVNDSEEGVDDEAQMIASFSPQDDEEDEDGDDTDKQIH